MDSSLLQTLRPSELDLSLSPPPAAQPSDAPIISLDRNQRHQHASHLRVRLTELLLTCASHTAASNFPRAEACLRLLSTLSSDTGDSLQRLAARLATTLAASLLRTRWAGLLFALHHPSAAPHGDPERAHLAFARALPYLPVARAVAGCTLLRALAHERDIHILDLGPTSSSRDLWSPLLRALARQPGGPPRVKFTFVGTDAKVLDSLCSELTKESADIDVVPYFNRVNTPLSKFDTDTLRIRSDETLAVVSVLSLHELLAEQPADRDDEEEEDEDFEESKKPRRRKRSRIDGVLAAVRGLSPKVVVMVEQEADHNSGRMAERFAEVLNYYGAVFESVEAAVGGGMMEGRERAAVEEMLGKEMENVVACEGEERVARHERSERWAERMRKARFRQVKVWYDAVEEAKRMVASWPGTGCYGVVVDRACLMITWKDRPLFAVSVWQPLKPYSISGSPSSQ